MALWKLKGVEDCSHTIALSLFTASDEGLILAAKLPKVNNPPGHFLAKRSPLCRTSLLQRHRQASRCRAPRGGTSSRDAPSCRSALHICVAFCLREGPYLFHSVC
jgi:hypothetical protein